MNKYKDITKLYNILDILDEYILINYKGNVEKIYMYKIEPIVMLGLSKIEQENILTIFKELLKQVNFDFQILMLNSKLNIEKYINNLISQTNISKLENINLKNNYIKDIKEKLIKEKIYETDYYIIISITYDTSIEIKDVDNVINKLKKIGCDVKKVKGKNNLEKLMYRCINKES